MKICHLTTSFWKCLSFLEPPLDFRDPGHTRISVPEKTFASFRVTCLFSTFTPACQGYQMWELQKSKWNGLLWYTSNNIHVYGFYIRQFFGRRIQPFCNRLLACRLKENWRRDLIDAVTHTIFRASRLIAFLLGFLLECIESGEVSCQTTCEAPRWMPSLFLLIAGKVPWNITLFPNMVVPTTVQQKMS